MFRHLFCDIGNSKPKERLWCLFELAAFLKSKKMTSGKQALIVRPLFLGPISIAIFTLSFVVALPLTTVSFDYFTIAMVQVMTPGLIGGLVVGYPAVACRLIETQTDFCCFFVWTEIRIKNTILGRFRFQPPFSQLKRVLFCSLFPFQNGTTCFHRF